jgi:hypothetical protein
VARTFKLEDGPRDWGSLMVQGNEDRAKFHRADGSFTQALHTLLSGSANTAHQDMVPIAAGVNCRSVRSRASAREGDLLSACKMAILPVVVVTGRDRKPITN